MQNKMTPKQVQQLIDNNEVQIDGIKGKALQPSQSPDDGFIEVPIRNVLLDLITIVHPDKTIDEILDTILDEFMETHKAQFFN